MLILPIASAEVSHERTRVFYVFLGCLGTGCIRWRGGVHLDWLASPQAAGEVDAGAWGHTILSKVPVGIHLLAVVAQDLPICRDALQYLHHHDILTMGKGKGACRLRAVPPTWPFTYLYGGIKP
jgi:hypothetical protein